MIQRNIDLTQALSFVMYARMSDASQNQTSPDQQYKEILERITRRHLPWEEEKRYRDDGITGRSIKQRTGYQTMFREIEDGVVKPRLILVDTIERFGRVEDLAEIRRKLFDKHGIAVLTADSDFADPTGALGRIMAMMENIRSTEDGRIKAHNVVRGKKDTVRQKQWPGGPAPFGFKLKKIVDPTNRLTGTYSILEPIPEEITLLLALFDRAAQTGEGPNRLAKWWNANTEIPDRFKPMTAAKVAYLLANQLYFGRLLWGKNNTDIIGDVRVIVPNPNGPSAISEDFCAPVVPVELFREVQRMRKLRSDAHRAKQPDADEVPEGFRPLGRGLTLKYLLAGLVRCGECGAAMRSVPSRHTQTNKAGGKKVYSYVHHSCPRHAAGACGNGQYFREDKLREAVVGRLRAKLFPLADSGALPAWLPGFFAAVDADIARTAAQQPDRTAARTARLEALEKQQRGWMLSLGDPELPHGIRGKLQENLAATSAEVDDLRAEAESSAALAAVNARLIDPDAVLKALRNLGDILAGENPTLGNLELSKHIDRIDCHPDGRVVLHGTMLGVLGEGAMLLTRKEPAGEAEKVDNGFPRITPRLKTRRFVPNLAAGDTAEVDQTHLLDPARFAGFAPEFFWAEEVFLERDIPWYEANAEAVARERRAGKTHAELAEKFRVSVPTIQKALRHAAATDPGLKALPKKMPRPRWQDSHYEDVARRKAEGESVADMAAFFGVSEPLVRSALVIAAQKAVGDGPQAEGPGEAV